MGEMVFITAAELQVGDVMANQFHRDEIVDITVRHISVDEDGYIGVQGSRGWGSYRPGRQVAIRPRD